MCVCSCVQFLTNRNRALESTPGQLNIGDHIPTLPPHITHTCLPDTPKYENVVFAEDLPTAVSSPDIPGMMREDDQMLDLQNQEHTLCRAVEDHTNFSDPEMLTFKVSVIYSVTVEYTMKMEWGQSQVWQWLDMIKAEQKNSDYMRSP